MRRDLRRRLRWQGELQVLQEHFQFGLRLRVASEHEFASVRRRDVRVDHLDSGKLLQHLARRQVFQSMTELDVQILGEKGDEDMRLDAVFMLGRSAGSPDRP